SFGLTVTMREAEFTAPLVREYLEGTRRNGSNPFADHQVFCEKGIDNLEDMIDLFWEQPFAFATFVYHRYPDQLTDAFAGRIYPTEHQPLALSARCSSARASTTKTITLCQSVPAFTPSGRHSGNLIPPSRQPSTGWGRGDFPASLNWGQDHGDTSETQRIHKQQSRFF